ncbi:MAG TPA: DUF4424 domain-containing protein [Allosphingosinicella sp.]|nr:DUF4424 domain-containing protein [Allosphingosinicella sp.]
MRLIAAALFLGAAGPALANDSSAATGAGGLVLTRNADIDMLSEDLYVSAREVRVRYVFRNRAARPVRITVAFPMPDRVLATAEEGDRAWPADFSTRVDGRPVRMAVERRAMARGVDHSALLRGLGIPILPVGESVLAEVSRALRRLTPAQGRRLESLGLVEGFDDPAAGRREYDPRWTVKETWHWEQIFPAGRDLVVEHRYTPGTGGTVSTGLGNAELRQHDYMRDQIRRYCADAAFLAAAGRIVRDPATVNVSEQWISYILTTGGNWRSPIGDFRLVVDKGDPRNLVSFCGQGVRRISPTRFEMRRRNWRPDRDLDILILVPAREGD